MPDVTGAALVALCLVGSVVATYLWSADAGRQARALNVLRMFLRARDGEVSAQPLMTAEDSPSAVSEGDTEQ